MLLVFLSSVDYVFHVLIHGWLIVVDPCYVYVPLSTLWQLLHASLLWGIPFPYRSRNTNEVLSTPFFIQTPLSTMKDSALTRNFLSHLSSWDNFPFVRYSIIGFLQSFVSVVTNITGVSSISFVCTIITNTFLVRWGKFEDGSFLNGQLVFSLISLHVPTWSSWTALLIPLLSLHIALYFFLESRITHLFGWLLPSSQ